MLAHADDASLLVVKNRNSQILWWNGRLAGLGAIQPHVQTPGLINPMRWETSHGSRGTKKLVGNYSADQGMKRPKLDLAAYVARMESDVSVELAKMWKIVRRCREKREKQG